MYEPIETVVTDMRMFMGVYGMNHLSPSFSSSRGSVDRRINRQLFMSPMSGRIALEKIEADNTMSSDKSTEESAIYTVKKINRLPCTHPACN